LLYALFTGLIFILIFLQERTSRDKGRIGT
jgi:hypothetical protein